MESRPTNPCICGRTEDCEYADPAAQAILPSAVVGHVNFAWAIAVRIDHQEAESIAAHFGGMSIGLCMPSGVVGGRDRDYLTGSRGRPDQQIAKIVPARFDGGSGRIVQRGYVLLQL